MNLGICRIVSRTEFLIHTFGSKRRSRGLGRGVAYDPVEPRAFISLRLAVDFVLAGAELAEVLGGTWNEVFVELECDTAQRLT